MTMFVSAKAAVIQFVALDFHRFEPTAILGQSPERSLTPCLGIGLRLGLETRDEIEHFLRLRLGKGLDFAEYALGRAHG